MSWGLVLALAAGAYAFKALGFLVFRADPADRRSCCGCGRSRVGSMAQGADDRRHRYRRGGDRCGARDQLNALRRCRGATTASTGASRLRRASMSPMSGANLNPCPLHGDATTTGPTRSMTKSSLGVVV